MYADSRYPLRMRWIFAIKVFALFTLCAAPSGAQVVINEVMSSNVNTLSDADGGTPDWLELYNAGIEPVDVGQYRLADDRSGNSGWILPRLLLDPGDFQLIYASGKDRRYAVRHWHTLIDWKAVWRYRLFTSEPPLDWNTLDFSAEDWNSGATGIGYGDGDDETRIPKTLTCYLRRQFILEQNPHPIVALLDVDYDDGFVAYLNGIEIARANIGTEGDRPAFDQPAFSSVEPRMVSGLPPERFLIENFGEITRQGRNLLCIQVHNRSLSSSDMTLIPFLTLGYDREPGFPSLVSEFIEAPTLYPHTDFRIDAEGEPLYLRDPDGQAVDSVILGPLPQDISYGRVPDGGVKWAYFQIPTPGAANTTAGSDSTFAPPPLFSRSGGRIESDFALELTSPVSDARLYYTLDGSEPDQNSLLYSEPIPLSADRTTVLRARAFSRDYLPSSTVTHTFFESRNYTLPLVSLATDPKNLWDEDSGIYIMGENAEAEFPHYGANFWQDWERPVHIEFYEADGKAGFSIDGGMKIFGGWCRAHPQRSLSLFAREGQYGYPCIEYALFPDQAIDRYYLSLIHI